MSNSKPPWELTTVDGLCTVNANVQFTAGELHSATVQGEQAGLALHDLEETINDLTSIYAVTREVIGAIALRQLDLEVAFAKGYVGALLKLDDLAATLTFNANALSFEVRPPVELLFRSDPGAICDQFGPDQLGVRANAVLTQGDTQSSLTLHFALGIAVSPTQAKFYLGRKVRVHALSPDASLDRLILSFIENTANDRLRQQLAGLILPTINLEGLTGSGLSIQQLTSQTTSHTSILATAVPITGPPPTEPGHPTPPIGSLDTWVHSSIRISPYLMLKVMKLELQKAIQKYPVRIEPLFGSIVPDPNDSNPNPDQRRKLLLVEGPAWCIDEFNDRENYGTQQVFASLQTRSGGADVLEVYMETRGVGSLIGQLGSLPKPTLLRVNNAERVEPTIRFEAIDIALRYRHL